MSIVGELPIGTVPIGSEEPAAPAAAIFEEDFLIFWELEDILTEDEQEVMIWS